MSRLIILLALAVVVQAQSTPTHRIQPVAQWTFKHAPQEIIFRDTEPGFPIQMLAFEDSLVWYNAAGHAVRTIARAAGDSLIISPHGRYFALVQETEQYTAREASGVLAVHVLDHDGERMYTHSEAFSLTSDDPRYALDDQGHLLLSDHGHGRLKEVFQDEIIWSQDLSTSFPENVRVLNARFVKQGGRGPRLLSADLYQYGRDDSLFVWLSLQRAKGKALQGGLAGELQRLEVLPNTTYTFLEVSKGQENSIYLLNGLEQLASYPWRAWDVKAINANSVFIVADDTFMVINLGDGRIEAQAGSYALYEVSDAAYLAGSDLFVTLRCEPFFREHGQLAYRNFELDAQDKAGRLVFKGTFGTWSPSLPRITPLSVDRFAVHLHNAVLLYAVKR
jgi:hypothetical protein